MVYFPLHLVVDERSKIPQLNISITRWVVDFVVSLHNDLMQEKITDQMFLCQLIMEEGIQECHKSVNVAGPILLDRC